MDNTKDRQAGATMPDTKNNVMTNSQSAAMPLQLETTNPGIHIILTMLIC